MAVEATDQRFTKEFILSQVTQEAIFTKYLGIIPNVDVKFSNPLRNDPTPNCKFKWFGNTLYFRDWLESNAFNCFEVVKRIYNCSYFESLQLICLHFGLLEVDISYDMRYTIQPKEQLEIAKITEKNEIRITRKKEWSKEDINYWKEYYLDYSDLEDTSPITTYWYNQIQHNAPRLSFAYHFYDYEYKLYFTQANKKKGECKFLHTNSQIIQGSRYFTYEKSTLILTSSYKDAKVLTRLDKNYDLDIEAGAPMSETTLISKEKIDFLKSKYKTVILYLNNDEAGLRESIKQADLYDIPYIVNPESVKEKDPSDYVKNNGLDAGVDLFNHLMYS